MCFLNFFDITVGVRQGENLSPILFALFLNDMKDYLKDALSGLPTVVNEMTDLCIPDSQLDKLLDMFILLYADDTVIFSETPSGLQAGLDAAQGYCKKWKLKLWGYIIKQHKHSICKKGRHYIGRFIPNIWTRFSSFAHQKRQLYLYKHKPISLQF